MSRRKIAIAVYLALWAASTIVIASRGEPSRGTIASDATRGFARVPAIERHGDELRATTEREVEFAYRDFGPRAAPVVVLLHGSPGSLQDFSALGRELAESRRVIVPDLPGFGDSSRRIPDYSARAHAAYLSALLDRLAVSRVHLVGFSMGGAVALEFAAAEPSRVASLSMVSALGVVELELFGDPRLNHAVHAAQYTLVRGVDLLLPHFGLFDRFVLGVPYARNFLDTDQTRLRPILERIESPMLLIHGEHDRLVPFAAAREHRRIVPQSELVELDADHFVLWTHPREVVAALEPFLDSVERGEALTRATATRERIEVASRPFDPGDVPPSSAIAQFVLAVLLALATLVSEDFACIGGGLLIAQGRMSALAAIGGCFVGIFVGDVLLFLCGRWFGAPLLRGASAGRSRLVSKEAIERGRALLDRHGAKAILISRFTPGLRLPTYLAAGALGMSLPRFALWFSIAGLLWTPILVLLSARFGGAVESVIASVSGFGALGVILAIGLVYFLWRFVIAMLTARGRRLLAGRLSRWKRWEFWPAWAFYPPVVGRLLALSWRHRKDGGFAVVTAVNPGIETSGFVGESKSAILRGLASAGDRVARFALVRIADSPEDRLATIARFRSEHALEFPVVMKPDVGQRGSGVQILRDEDSLVRFVREGMTLDHVVQEYVAGVEYGIFWLRVPGEERGRVFSVTEKRMPVVIGDGRSTLERLILADDRAVCVAQGYFERNRDRLHSVPAPGERVQLVELGTHCRGAIFLDGSQDVLTPELESWIEAVSRGFEGFHFGRYDVRGPSLDHFRRAEGIKVIELNGVTSEATHLYDPKHSLREAYAILFEQWRLAFAIGAHNARLGAPITPPLSLLRRFLAYRREQRGHAPS